MGDRLIRYQVCRRRGFEDARLSQKATTRQNGKEKVRQPNGRGQRHSFAYKRALVGKRNKGFCDMPENVRGGADLISSALVRAA